MRTAPCTYPYLCCPRCAWIYSTFPHDTPPPSHRTPTPMRQTEGGPGSGGAGQWPQYSPSQDDYLRLDTLPNRVVITGVHSSTCDAWDAVSPALGTLGTRQPTPLGQMEGHILVATKL